MGLCEEWIQLVNMCIQSVQYKVLVNGCEVGPITPERGLRQGDPISPYLFVIGAGGLSKLLQDRERRGEIHGCAITRGAPRITHLFFADDSYLFFRTEPRECETVKGLLAEYSMGSGLEINLQKSTLLFSKNVTVDRRAEITQLFGITEDMGGGTYLGMPMLSGRKKCVAFRFVIDKLWTKIATWKKKRLSKAGKEILLKTVAQALPSYVMSLFLIPKEICEEMQKIMNSYWWCDAQEGGGIRWKSWERLCVKKQQGGLGFKRLCDLNLALVAKQGWRCMTTPNCLMAQTLKAKYFRNSGFLEAKVGNNSSFIWRSIWKSIELIKLGARKKVGRGDSIFVWGDPWMIDHDNPVLQPWSNTLEVNMKVADIIVQGERRWNTEVIHQLFSVRDRARILAIPLSSHDCDDEWTWVGERKGDYSVKSGYHVWTNQGGDMSGGVEGEIWKNMWASYAPPKMLMCFWRILSNCLPTKYNLAQRKVNLESNVCPVCGHGVESITHLIMECHFSTQIWRLAGLHYIVREVTDVLTWATHVFNTLHRELWGTVVAICWAIWSHRNEVLWNKKFSTVRQVLTKGLSMLTAWRDAGRKEITEAECARLAGVQAVWRRPKLDWTKINVDAACKDGWGTTSMVRRNDLGLFIGGMTRKVEMCMDPGLLEAMAIREALSWVKSRNKTKVIVESDCAVAVTALTDHSRYNSAFGTIITECRNLLATLSEVRVVFIRRDANTAAHLLARAACSFSDRYVWGRTPPNCITAALAADLTH